jgi:hypothetical protein
VIKFSSRLDIYLPRDSRIMVEVGGIAKAGETIIGEMQDAPLASRSLLSSG